MSHKVKVFFSCLFILFMFASTAVAADATVWITTSGRGYAYHYDENCRTLSRSVTQAISLSDARQRGLTPCQVCSSGSAGAGASDSGGADLRAISRPRQQQTLTGFPAGTLPGDNIGGSGTGTSLPLGRVAMSGEPLAPIIGPEMVGSKLDHLSVIAGHVGYTLVNVAYSPTVIDTPYTFALMNGKRKVSTLYFNRNMVLVSVE